MEVSDRFWNKVAILDQESCWLWTASLDGRGYGQFWDGERRYIAHRFAYEWWFSRQLGELYCLHKCDNPKCVNPFHLFVGTQSDNMQDMMSKGRRYQPNVSGENNGRAKLSVENVQEIRISLSLGCSINSLANKYRVSWMTISRILTGEGWK